jgi:hypothetical protein
MVDELDELRAIQVLVGSGWYETNTLEQEGSSDEKN